MQPTTNFIACTYLQIYQALFTYVHHLPIYHAFKKVNSEVWTGQISRDTYRSEVSLK